MQMHTRLRVWRDCMRTDVGVLVLLLALFATRTFAYLLNASLPVAHMIDTREGVSPLIWGGTAAVIAAALATRKRTLHTASLVVAVMVLTLWGALFVFQGIPALLLYGSPYLAVAAGTVYTVWRGNAQELHVYGGGDDVRSDND